MIQIGHAKLKPTGHAHRIRIAQQHRLGGAEQFRPTDLSPGLGDALGGRLRPLEKIGAGSLQILVAETAAQGQGQMPVIPSGEVLELAAQSGADRLEQALPNLRRNPAQ